MKTVIIILIGMIFVLSFFIYKLFHELRLINRQAEIKKKTDSNFIIACDIDIKTFNDLCNNINVIYKSYYNEKLESKKKEKEFKEMLSYIAHDVRTPLTSVQGYIQILKENDLNNENEAYYTIVDHRIHDIKNLLEQFFIYSKLLDYDYQVEVERCNLYDTCCDSLASFYQTFLSKKVEPRLNFKQQNLILNVNKDLMRRIFDNLINNALVHGNGNILIKQSENKLIFSNAFKEEMKIDKYKVFERFYKADSSRTTISSGLGLSIVKEIIELFGWIVDVDIQDNMFIVVITMIEN